VAALATALTRAALSASLVRAAMLVAIPALAAVALAAWVLTNRVALDLTEWCDCAGRTVRVRIVATPAPPTPRPTAPDPRPVERATLHA